MSLLSGPAMSAVEGLQAAEAWCNDTVGILQRIFDDTEKLEQEQLS